jgi:3-hydroxyisobutyrate dehydrogenase-like beta-hydroxyacid dehydrogenase
MERGVIGLGRMGGAMARNLAKAGHRVRAWNRSPLAGTLPAGMEIVSCPAEALQADAAFTMLSDDSVIRDVLLSSGALDSARSGLVHVVTSTISVGFADELRGLHDTAGLAAAAAERTGHALPLLDAVRARMAEAVESGLADKDWSAIADYTLHS